MPIYEYQCLSCGRRSEVMQKMADPPLDTCTVCSGPLKKLISAPAFQFKGSGWYVTDYAKKGEAEKREQGEKGEKADKGDKGDKADKGEKTDKTERASSDAGKDPAAKKDAGGKEPTATKGDGGKGEGSGTGSSSKGAAGGD